MLIAIWGRDGMGKSTIADALGCLIAKKGITAVVDTDLTQPTLPVRLSGQHFDMETSLGKVVSGVGIADVAPFLHQHPKHKRLFYAGLTNRDEYLSYEIGLEADNQAQDFIEACQDITDTVILDLSGQRTDPFVPCALINADKIIIPITPDVQGVCWFHAVRSLLHSMNAKARILPVAVKTDKHHDLSTIEKAIDIQFTATLPFVKEFRQKTIASPLEGSTPAAFQYVKQIKKLWGTLKGVEEV